MAKPKAPAQQQPPPATPKVVEEFSANIVQDPVTIQGEWKATVLECSEDIDCVQYSELHEYLLAGFNNGKIRVFKDLKCVMTLMDKDIEAKKSEVTGMKHRPVSKNYPVSNALICTYASGYVKCWNYNFQECTFTLNEGRKTTGIAYHPKLAKFVTMGDNKKIYMYDEDSKRQERVLSSSDDMNAKDGHTDVVMAACFHPKQGNELISGGMDNTIQFWDTRQPHAVRNIAGVTIAGDGIDFSQRGSEFVTCSWQKDKPMRLWDYKSGKELNVIEPDKHKNVMLRFGAYINKSNVICGGGEPNLVRIVDMNNFQSISTITNIGKMIGNITIGPSDGVNIPKYAFCAGRKIYEITPK